MKALGWPSDRTEALRGFFPPKIVHRKVASHVLRMFAIRIEGFDFLFEALNISCSLSKTILESIRLTRKAKHDPDHYINASPGHKDDKRLTSKPLWLHMTSTGKAMFANI